MFFAENLINIDHCFFSKLGGNSSKIYESLNCGRGSNDLIKNINSNLKTVADYYGLSPTQITTLYQTHSNKSLLLNKKILNNNYQYDGIVTNQKNIILSILTADCAPILFYDYKKIIIGACHVGWRGALSGIIKNTLKNMIILGSKSKNIRCAIGPCIGQNSYSVKKEFYHSFVFKNKKNYKFFKKLGSNNYLFSLESFILNQLKLLGIENIHSINIDTFAEEDLCYSYRRSILKKENDYGRMISTIVIKD